MKVGIITIGDELLIGQTINTNASWIGQELTKNGLAIYRSVTIRDHRQDILESLGDLIHKAEIIIITGGLGPTKDDITKQTLCEFFNTKLLRNDMVLKRINDYFESRGKKMLPSNETQADLPEDAIVLDNLLGTASGMWFEKGGSIVVSIPGVPYEMKAIMTNEVLPRIKARFGDTSVYFQTVMTQGIGESFLAEKIKDWEERIYADGMGLAYLPSPGLVKLRITSSDGAKDAGKIKEYVDEIRDRLPEFVYGMNEESIFEVTGELLRQRNHTLCTVESCTGGGIANAFVQKTGCSDFFNGGLITYCNDLKIKLAGVQTETLKKHGAVSEKTVTEMALGGKKKLGTDYAVAVSGIAGPTGGTVEKPVGLVWAAVAHPDGVRTERFLFGDDRGRNLLKTQLYAVNLLRRVILSID
ncbi:MAG: CinA family nicotinamide mononucleotide deamidase-related protein [Brumimicrobium sp.]|nr:CinA family nicotinamide mononucleotide deamidase-related protein [Brumimicrobium sp.]